MIQIKEDKKTKTEPKNTLLIQNPSQLSQISRLRQKC